MPAKTIRQTMLQTALELLKIDLARVNDPSPEAAKGTLTKRIQSWEEVIKRYNSETMDRPVRHEYRLTDKGLALHPVVMAIVRWGDVHYAGAEGPPLLHRHKACGCDFHPVQTCSECGDPVDPRDVEVRSSR